MAYVLDLTLDVTLPASPANKYHIYSFVQNAQNLQSVCDLASCPVWRYSGYWWNVQQ